MFAAAALLPCAQWRRLIFPYPESERCAPVEIGAVDRVLATGASGFIGPAPATALVARSATVQVLVRSTHSRANLPPCVEIVEGDTRDALGWLAQHGPLR